LISIVHNVAVFGTFPILWFLAFFCLLPVGLGGEHDPVTGAPLKPMLARKALIATAIALVLWAIFYALIALKVLDL
jgi:predicted secreted protein